MYHYSTRHIRKLAHCSGNYTSSVLVVCMCIGVFIISFVSCKCVTRYPTYTLDKVSDLIQDSIRWSEVADQDTNPVIALIHSTYALAYLNVSRKLVCDTDIEKISNLHAGELHKDIKYKQDRITQRLFKKYPKLRPNGKSCVASGTGWIR
jgi:hypothetical protein